MQRYFADIIDGYAKLDEDQVFHITRVMRQREGENFELVAHDQLYLMEITSIKPFRAIVKSKIKENNELKNDVVLIAAPLKGDKFDFMIQKATELGVEEIVLLNTVRTVAKISNLSKDFKLDRYRRIIKEAAEQSKRTRLPVLRHCINLNELKMIKADIKLIAYEEEAGYSDSFNKELKKIKAKDRIAIIIGPEGGFEPGVVETAKQNGYVPISLGKRILRAETASLYALSVIGNYLDKK